MGEDRTCSSGDMIADRQTDKHTHTDRHAHRNIPRSPIGSGAVIERSSPDALRSQCLPTIGRKLQPQQKVINRASAVRATSRLRNIHWRATSHRSPGIPTTCIPTSRPTATSAARAATVFENTCRDSDVISFRIYASWFSSPSCGQNSVKCLSLW